MEFDNLFRQLKRKKKVFIQTRNKVYSLHLFVCQRGEHLGSSSRM